MTALLPHPGRNVYAHDLADYGDDDPNYIYNLDSDVVDLKANVHKQCPKAPAFAGNGTLPRPCLTSQQWHSLQPDARATWDLLSDEAKAIILGLHKDPGKQMANLHNISAYDFIQVNMHDLHLERSIEDNNNTPPDPDDDHGDSGTQAEEDNNTELLAYLSKQKGSTNPGHLANVLSTSKAKNTKEMKFMSMPNADTPPPKNEENVVNGKRYHQVHTHCILYSVSSHKSCKAGSLVDRGANGGIAGDDVCIIEKSDQTVDVHSIDNHQITNIPIVTAGGLITTQHGPVIAILHQYAYTGQASGQLEWYKNDMNDKSIKVAGGMQCIQTNDGYVIPISTILVLRKNKSHF